jgi:hypothetical protein
MSKVNFFEEFANMSLNNQTQNSGDVNVVMKMMGDVSIDKVKTKKVEEEKQEKFKHSSSIIFTKGQYKSYSGFVYEFYPSKVYVEISELIYVSPSMYGERNIGDKIGLCCEVINKIDKMYGIMIKDGKEEVRIFNNYCIHLVFVNINGIKKLGCIQRGKNEELHIFDLQDFTNDSVASDSVASESEVLLKLSEIVKEGKFNNLKYEIVKVNLYEILCSEYCMIIKGSENCDNDYTGEFGKISRFIEEQYVLECKKKVFIQKSMVEIEQDNVVIKKGMYKNKIGKLLQFEKGSMKINIEALGLMIYSHKIKEDNLYVDKKITVDDIFYQDLKLKDGNYFQISKVVGDKIYGTTLIGNIYKDEIINKSDIVKFISGCSINNISQSEIDNKYDTHQDVVFDDSVASERVEEVDDDDNENEDQCDYETGNEIVEITDKDMEVKEVEMKNSFKDVERTNYVSKVFTKEEKDILKYISKVVELMGYADDIINIYEVIEKISSIKNIIKKDLKALDIEEWKDSDMKYIITCIVCYEIIKSGFSITKKLFDSYIIKLIKTKFFIKSNISGSLFLRNVDNNNVRTCMDVIKMTSDEKVNLNKTYKGGEYSEIIKVMIKNCNLLLQEIYGKVIFVDEMYKIEYIPVCKPKYIKEYPKYFMTSNEIALGLEIPKTANKIIWNPDTMKVLKRLKSALVMKCNNEQNNTLKIVYKFVIENLDNAPFVLQNANNKDLLKIEELKYKELKRTFDMFINKIKVLLDEKERLRNVKIQNIKQEKEILNKKRKEYEDNDVSLEEIELSMQKMMIRNNNNISKRIRQ